MKKAGIGRLTDRPATSNIREAPLGAPTDGNRAGRAPYNFVPPPTKLRLDATIPPTADRYHDKHNSGEILLNITAETDFYIRGMWELSQFVNPPSNMETDVKDQTRPFFQGKRLPGSSLRGLIRSLVEILSDAPLDPLSRQRFAFRTLGGSADTSSKTFEPCHQTWTARIKNARGGYLVPGSGDTGWKIVPAQTIKGLGTFCKFPDSTFDEPPAAVRFPTPITPTTGYDQAPEASCCKTSNESGFSALPHQGWRIRSGQIEKKCHQWIIYEPDHPNKAVSISETSVRIHREAGLTTWVEEWRASCPDGIPCFFSQIEGEVWFGPTRNFKIPSMIRVDEANPAPRPSPITGWDLAQAIFGRLKGKNANGARTRVFFEDAFLTSGDVSKTERIETVFGQPKPTTFQHYLQQPSWLQQDSIPWSRDGQPPEKARLRGLKMYWHRKKQIPMPDQSGETADRREKQNTVFKKVVVDQSRKPVFTAKVRFENLTNVELGALLCALELPKGLRHQLGLAKPFGLGVIHVEVDKVLVTRPQMRYGTFVEAVPDLAGAEIPATLVDGFEEKTVTEFQKEFAKTWHQEDSVESLWEVPRFQELKALLTWDDLPADAETWNNMTRYLAFGQLQEPSGRFDYNEYVRVGHGETGFPPHYRGRANPRQERRRPLPPATTVLRDACNTDGGVLPRDRRPDYLKPVGAAAAGALKAGSRGRYPGRGGGRTHGSAQSEDRSRDDVDREV
jgi:CRISPR-associated protein (TIGR03986 family)